MFVLLLSLSCFILLQTPQASSLRRGPLQVIDAAGPSLQKAEQSRPGSRPGSSPESGPESVEKGAGLMEKLLRLDEACREENDVMEPKKKRGFSGNSAPLDRLSAGGSSMEARAGQKPSKVPETPRRKAGPPPIDRIGAARLPGNKG